MPALDKFSGSAPARMDSSIHSIFPQSFSLSLIISFMKMEFSMRFLAAMSLLLLVSMSTEMGGPLMADAACDRNLCVKGCNLLDYNLGCCAVLQECSYCFCSDADKCPLQTTLAIKIGEKTMMIAATPKKSFIKELVA